MTDSSPRPRGTGPARRVWAGALVGAVVAAGLAAATVETATAAAGTISGTVVVPAGHSPTDLQVRFIGDQDSKPGAVSVEQNGSWSLPWTKAECGIIQLDSISGYVTSYRSEVSFCSGDVVPTITLAPAGAISGTTNAGTSTQASTATALDADLTIVGQAWVPSDGNYRIGGLPAGTYTVAFDMYGADHDGLDTIWATQNQVIYYDGATGTPDRPNPLDTAPGKTVDVTVGATTTGINATMRRGSSALGRLTCANGVTANPAEAIADPRDASGRLTRRLGYDNSPTTAASGRYLIDGLSPELSYTNLVYGCTDPDGNDLAVYTGNTLNPTRATKYLAATPPEDEQLDARTALLFNDVSARTKFASDIQWMVRYGYTTGYPDFTYRPVTPVRRDAMAAFLFRLAGSPADFQPTWCDFVDITPKTQFYKEMCFLREYGISTGWSTPHGQEFRPGLPIARDAMARFLYVFGGEADITTTYPFADVTRNTTFAREMSWMSQSGISQGWKIGAATYYRPLSPVNRDAMAAFLKRYVIWYDTTHADVEAGPSTTGVPQASTSHLRATPVR